MAGFPYRRINIVGAPGSGTSTLGRALSSRLGYQFFDADDFYWQPTTPPFKQKYTPDVRLAGLLDAVSRHEATVVSGSVCGWGDELEDAFDLVIFLSLPTALRLERIRARELAWFGHADPAFLAWAGQYEQGSLPGRSRARHEAWLSGRHCRVLRFEADVNVEDRVGEVINAVRSEHR